MLETLLLTGEIPEIQWKHGDDLCDCTFQRIGWWTNPYIARTIEIRLCCAWKVLIEKNPELQQFYREIPAFDNYNTGRYETEPMEWNCDHDMPRDIWYRQLAAKENRPLAEIRRDYGHLEAPRAVREPEPEPLAINNLLSFLQQEAERSGFDIVIEGFAAPSEGAA